MLKTITINWMLLILILSFSGALSAQKNGLVEPCSMAIDKARDQQAFDICETQLQKAINNVDQQAQADIYLELIEVSHALGQTERQQGYLQKLKSHPLFSTKQKYQYLWNRWNGRILLHSKETELAKKFFYECLNIAVLANDQQWLLRSYSDVGSIERKSNNLNRALYYYNKSLSISREVGNAYNVGQNLFNIAVVYSELEEYDNSDKYFEKTLESFNQYTLTENYNKRVHRSIAHVYQYLLTNNIKSGNTLSLNDNYRHLLENFKENFNAHEQIGMLISFARYYTDLKEYKLAQSFLEDALRLDGGKSSNYTAQIYFDLSVITFAQNKFPQAINQAKLAIENAQLHNNIKVEFESYQLLSEIYSVTDLNQSIVYLKKYQAKREDFLETKYDKSVKNMQHQFEKQQIESDLLKSNIINANQKNKIDQLKINALLIFIILTFISLIFLYFIYKKRIEKRELLKSINHHKQQLLILQEDQKHEAQPDIETDKEKLAHQLKENLVKAMINALQIWEKHTDTNRVELADQSKIWTVSIDNGNLRTRSLDKYLSIEKIPKNPRWRNVVKTCHFILSDSSLMLDDRARLEANLAEIMKTIESLSL